MGLNVSILTINMVTTTITKNLPIPPRFTPYQFSSRCKLSILLTRQPMVKFYVLTLSATDARIKILL